MAKRPRHCVGPCGSLLPCPGPPGPPWPSTAGVMHGRSVSCVCISAHSSAPQLHVADTLVPSLHVGCEGEPQPGPHSSSVAFGGCERPREEVRDTEVLDPGRQDSPAAVGTGSDGRVLSPVPGAQGEVEAGNGKGGRWEGGDRCPPLPRAPSSCSGGSGEGESPGGLALLCSCDQAGRGVLTGKRLLEEALRFLLCSVDLQADENC